MPLPAREAAYREVLAEAMAVRRARYDERMRQASRWLPMPQPGTPRTARLLAEIERARSRAARARDALATTLAALRADERIEAAGWTDKRLRAGRAARQRARRGGRPMTPDEDRANREYCRRRKAARRAAGAT
jgi:hypothetical protein